MILHLTRSCILFGLLAVLASETTSVSQAQGKKDDSKVQLFEDNDFGGKSIVVHKDNPALAKRDFNDALSSMKWTVPKGTAIVLYSDNDFENPAIVLVGTGEAANFDMFPDSNDTISSIAFLPLGKNGYPRGMKKLPRLGTE